jgi:hypothetical protein
MLPRYEALSANDQIRVTRRPHRRALVAAAIVGLIIAAVISGVVIIYLSVKYDD